MYFTKCLFVYRSMCTFIPVQYDPPAVFHAIVNCDTSLVLEIFNVEEGQTVVNVATESLVLADGQFIHQLGYKVRCPSNDESLHCQNTPKKCSALKSKYFHQTKTT